MCNIASKTPGLYVKTLDQDRCMHKAELASAMLNSKQLSQALYCIVLEHAMQQMLGCCSVQHCSKQRSACLGEQGYAFCLYLAWKTCPLVPTASKACTLSIEKSEAACWAAASGHMQPTRGEATPGTSGEAFAASATLMQCFL